MRAGIAGEVLERGVGLTAVLADVRVGFRTLEEDMLSLAAETVWAAIAKKCLGVGILRAAALAVDGGGLGNGDIPCAVVGGSGGGQTKNGTGGEDGQKQKFPMFHGERCHHTTFIPTEKALFRTAAQKDDETTR